VRGSKKLELLLQPTRTEDKRRSHCTCAELTAENAPVPSSPFAKIIQANRKKRVDPGTQISECVLNCKHNRRSEMHQTIEPAILYAGTPVVLISTMNEDGSPNLSPMSSAWWLGWSCMLGLDATSKTTANLRRTRECVLNLASVDLVGAVDNLAMLTGSDPLPLHKKLLGYRHARDKFAAAGLTQQSSELVKAPRVRECGIQMEARVTVMTAFATKDPRMAIPTRAIEVTIERVHVDPKLLADGHPNRIDPDKWKPLIMSFRQFYGVSENLHPSKLGKGPEEAYAPWKTKGLKGTVSKAVLGLANAKHRKHEPSDLAPVPDDASELS
jgi:flavin reductase (DIM6/NTAB) family NADH-FMN oxidoreductase RutF